MVKRVYIGPHDEVELAATAQVVRRGESIEVDGDLAEQLDTQPGNWAKPTTTAARDADAPPARPDVPATTFDGLPVDGPLTAEQPAVADVLDVPTADGSEQ